VKFSKGNCESAKVGNTKVCRFLDYDPKFIDKNGMSRNGRCVPMQVEPAETDCPMLKTEKCTLVGYLTGVKCRN
jgi:hypothetical protein